MLVGIGWEVDWGENGLAYLIGEIPLLQPQIGGNVLVDRPGKLVVQLPRHKTQYHRPQGQHAGRSNQAGIQILQRADIDIPCPKLPDRLIDLVDLHRRIYHHAQIVQTEPNHLNRILQSQRIPHQQQLIYEPEYENRQIRGYRQRARRRIAAFRRRRQTRLELPEHVRLQAQADDGLGQRHEGEGPGPRRAGHVHLASVSAT